MNEKPEQYKKNNEPVNIALFASGSGTDANAILDAQDRGLINDGRITLLVATKENAGCIDVGKNHKVKVEVVSKSKLKNDFASEVKKVLHENHINLAFLVGCIHMIPVLPDIPMYNIHPADIKQHGGKGYYGIKVHQSVLTKIKAEMEDDRERGINRWFTWITIHEVDNHYDHGKPFIRAAVEVFPETDDEFILQKRVLQYEWMMLPTAVNMAIRRLKMKR
ncbi:MAG: formyltransferase family protein [bacterium]